MMRGRDLRRILTSEEIPYSIELTAIGHNDDDYETNDLQQVTDNNVYADANDQQHLVNEDTEINNDSSHQSGRPNTNISGEVIHDQINLPVPIANSASMSNLFLTRNHRLVGDNTGDTSLITNSITTEITADFGPIIGYAKEPLLPLWKACAPLSHVLHNLSFYVQMALDERPEKPADGLTIDESAAIRLYTIEWEEPHPSLYSMLNSALDTADRKHLRPYFKYLKLFLTALVKLPCVQPQTVWRGVTQDLSAKYPPDTLVKWWAFSSTTAELTVLRNNIYLGNSGNRTLFSVEAINGRTIRAHSHFDDENEILLLPGTYMTVQSQLSPAPDLHIIHLKQERPQEVLLEPPFEGILNGFYNLLYINNFSIFRCDSLSKN